MKNDTSPSARQPYSYADALRSLLIIPPGDRQPPSQAGGEHIPPAGQPTPPHGLQPRHPRGRPARSPLCQPYSAASAVALPVVAWHRSAVQLLGTDLLAGVSPCRSHPCSAACRRSPAGQASKLGLSLAVKLAAGAALQLLARLLHPCG